MKPGRSHEQEEEEEQRPTGSFYEARVGVVRDEGDRQLSEVELQGTGDDVDVVVDVGGDVSFLSICRTSQDIKLKDQQDVIGEAAERPDRYSHLYRTPA